MRSTTPTMRTRSRTARDGPSSSRVGISWFFLTVDFAFGHGLEKQVTDVVTAAGGRVVGSARHPLNTTDFSSFLLQAQASKAKIIGVASTGADAINAIKGAAEFGLTKNQKLAALLLWINDVHSLGLRDGARPAAHQRLVLGHER